MFSRHSQQTHKSFIIRLIAAYFCCQMPGYIPLRLFVPRVKCQKCETCLMTGWRSDCGVLIFQVFDAFIVITSFVADLCLLLLLPDYNTRDFVFILAFLLPWRVIRVVDSTCSNSNNQISLQ